MAEIKENLLYTKEHDWLRIEGELAYIGITDYAQAALGEIVFADHEPLDSQIALEGPLGVVESVKAASDIASPVSGTLVEVDEAVIETPDLINSEPYAHAMFVIRLDDPSQLEGMLDAAGYAAYCEGLH